jgi:hypothetical protein
VLGQHLLADAGLAAHQHADLADRDPLDQGQDRRHRPDRARRWRRGDRRRPTEARRDRRAQAPGVGAVAREAGHRHRRAGHRGAERAGQRRRASLVEVGGQDLPLARRIAADDVDLADRGGQPIGGVAGRRADPEQGEAGAGPLGAHALLGQPQLEVAMAPQRPGRRHRHPPLHQHGEPPQPDRLVDRDRARRLGGQARAAHGRAMARAEIGDRQHLADLEARVAARQRRLVDADRAARVAPDHDRAGRRQRERGEPTGAAQDDQARATRDLGERRRRGRGRARAGVPHRDRGYNTVARPMIPRAPHRAAAVAHISATGSDRRCRRFVASAPSCAVDRAAVAVGARPRA